VVAPLVLDGPMNTTIFVTYLKECLAPKLKRGDVVIMDNLPVRVAAVREVIEEAGAKLRYPPKYSPDLNPIEQAFSKLKAHLPNYSAPLAQNRNARGRIQPARMHQLLPICRICV
jgi:transposase